MEKEKGIELLEELLYRPEPNEKLRNLAFLILKNCKTAHETQMVLDG